MRYGEFTLPEVYKDQTRVINGVYSFVNGVLRANESDVKKIETTLCRYYGCTLTWKTIEENKDTPVETSLAKDVTKGSTVSAAVQASTAAAQQPSSPAPVAPAGK